MSASWKNAMLRREHKERHQPANRAHMGLLEKHKDYTQRAKDFNAKKDRIKTLKRKAEERNPDEFNFKMTKTKTKGGVHVVERPDNMTGDLYKVLKTQDLGYVRTVCSTEEKKAEALKSTLHFLDGSLPRGQHSVFVDSEAEAQGFSGAAYLDTAPELVGRTYNRPRLATLKEATVQGVAPGVMKAASKARDKAYEELSSRIDRVEHLKKAREHLTLQRQLTTKGARLKVKSADGDQPPVFKWKPIRKK